MAQAKDLSEITQISLGSINVRFEASPDQGGQPPCLISNEVGNIPRGRYAEFGEPVFVKVPGKNSPSTSKANTNFTFCRRLISRAGVAYQFRYSEDKLPEGITEEVLVEGLTRQVCEVLLEGGNIDMPGRHHKYRQRPRLGRLRDHDELKLKTATIPYRASTKFFKEEEKRWTDQMSMNEEQKIEEVALQLRYWNYFDRDTRNPAVERFAKIL